MRQKEGSELRCTDPSPRGQRISPWAVCGVGLRRVGYVLAGCQIHEDVGFVGLNRVFATTAADGVLATRRLVNISVDYVIASSSAHEIVALVTLQVIATIFTVELVVSAVTGQLLRAFQLGGDWVRSAMELILVSGTLHSVEAPPAKHHIFASTAVAIWRFRARKDGITVFREDVIAGATVIGVVAIVTVRFVVLTASPQLVSGILCIQGIAPPEGLDEIRVIGAFKGFSTIGAFYDPCQRHSANQHHHRRHGHQDQYRSPSHLFSPSGLFAS